MPPEKIRKIGGGLGSHISCSQIAGVIPVKLLDKKLISCVKNRKNKLN